jgi:hypothetical protein
VCLFVCVFMGVVVRSVNLLCSFLFCVSLAFLF